MMLQRISDFFEVLNQEWETGMWLMSDLGITGSEINDACIPFNPSNFKFP